jgi:hypothetical protein
LVNLGNPQSQTEIFFCDNLCAVGIANNKSYLYIVVYLLYLIRLIANINHIFIKSSSNISFVKNTLNFIIQAQQPISYPAV